MAKRKPKLVSIEDAGNILDADLRKWFESKFPAVDPDGTLELFTDKALAKGWLYADWRAALRNYVRRGKEWGGIAYKRGLSPEFDALITRARSIGFRMPQRGESAGVYRTALDTFDRQSAQRVSKQLNLGGVLKRVEK